MTVVAVDNGRQLPCSLLHEGSDVVVADVHRSGDVARLPGTEIPHIDEQCPVGFQKCEGLVHRDLGRFHEAIMARRPPSDTLHEESTLEAMQVERVLAQQLQIPSTGRHNPIPSEASTRRR